jgi:hypothetical protein
MKNRLETAGGKQDIFFPWTRDLAPTFQESYGTDLLEHLLRMRGIQDCLRRRATCIRIMVSLSLAIRCTKGSLRLKRASTYAATILHGLTMAGEAKRDYPAAIGYQGPWHRDYRLVEGYFARVNYALSRGRGGHPGRCRSSDRELLSPVGAKWNFNGCYREGTAVLRIDVMAVPRIDGVRLHLRVFTVSLLLFRVNTTSLT